MYFPDKNNKPKSRSELVEENAAEEYEKIKAHLVALAEGDPHKLLSYFEYLQNVVNAREDGTLTLGECASILRILADSMTEGDKVCRKD